MKTKAEKTKCVWDSSTGIPGLLLNRESGRYYSRVQVNGRRTMQALKTNDFQTAKGRHYDTLATAEKQRSRTTDAEAGTANMGTLLKLAGEAYLANPNLSESAKKGFRCNVRRLTTYWPLCFGRDLDMMKPDRITGAMVEKFANYLETEARWTRPNNGGECRGYGAVSVNLTIELLHRVLRFAKARGYILAVPFELKSQLGNSGLLRSEPRKKLRFPTDEKIRLVLTTMRTLPEALRADSADIQGYLLARYEESADFAEFMAYSGARVKEAARWTWEDEGERIITIRGTKTETSRNREVPKLPAMVALLARMKARRLAAGRELKGRAFKISECREALATACKRAGVDRWTHHTLRHLFATRCIEAGVDIPTVSRWLGHADGGTLALSTYGHLRQEHSLAQAAKVTFGIAA